MGINDLNTVVNEMDVQDRYRTALRKSFRDITFESKFNTDGLAYSLTHKLRMIIEHKHKYNFIIVRERAKVIAQLIKYLKNIHDNDPAIIPQVAVIGDENECFVLPVKDIINYISVKEYNWSLPPSSMYKDETLMIDLINDDVVKNLYIYDPNLEFEGVINKIKHINKGVRVPRTLTEKNIDKVYQYFINKINIKKGGKKISVNESVNLFAHIMLHPDSVMLNNKTKLLFTSMFKEPLSIGNIDSFTSFINEFSRKYTPKQKHAFTAILDRLIEDTTRRKQGEFFTPVIWVKKGHEYITSVYGENWKEEYVVWDPAWGTGNLTREYKFKELYVSTLNQSDIDTANQMGYNPEAVKFQYDFLNDNYDKLPEGLRKAIEEGRQIIVLMNPPYTDGSELTTKKGESKIGGGVNTMVNEEMKSLKIGKCSKQLYAQFIYKTLNLREDIKMAIFSPSLYLSGESYDVFQDKVIKKIKLNKGFLFSGTHFADTSGDWPILFSVWGGEESDGVVDLLDANTDGIIEKIGVKTIYRPKQRLIKTIKNSESKLVLGNCSYQGNSVSGNNQFVTILPNNKKLSGKGNFIIGEDNFLDIVTFFSSRRMISGKFCNWITYYDEYLTPNEEHEHLEQFKYDSLVYSLFESKSNQSSLRQVEYKGKLWDINNEFFWMSVNQMKELADDNGYDELYRDAQTSSNRHVYNLLFGEERIYDKLSPDAKLVLDKATELVEMSIQMRQQMPDDENHLDSWDAGYAQLKLVWKEYFPEQFKEFRQLYKNMEDRMRPLVYELGFLLK